LRSFLREKKKVIINAKIFKRFRRKKLKKSNKFGSLNKVKIESVCVYCWIEKKGSAKG